MPSPLLATCRAVVLSVILAFALPAIADEPSSSVLILEPGGYIPGGLDDSTPPTHGWLALVEHDGHWNLVPAKVDLDPEIRSPDQPKALVFLHARQLSAGKVSTLAMKLPDDMYPSENAAVDKGTERLELTFNARRYRLILSAPRPETGGNLVLDDGHTSTVLNTDTDGAQLMWAGDLDHDGRLDLIVNTDHEDGKSGDTCLYLSSAAGKHQLVKQVACQYFSG